MLAMSDGQDSGLDVDDDQAVAEELDDDRFDDDMIGYPPDRALASLEATAPIETGDVPQDSLEERLWREEPDDLTRADEAVEILEPHPDAAYDTDFAASSRFELAEEPTDDHELVGQIVDPDGSDPAEELAIHVVDEPG